MELKLLSCDWRLAASGDWARAGSSRGRWRDGKHHETDARLETSLKPTKHLPASPPSRHRPAQQAPPSPCIAAYSQTSRLVVAA